MKVGILTFHRATNIGAVLQASALNSYIERKGIKCEIIDFIPNNEIPDLSTLHKMLHYLKCALTLPSSIQRKKKKKKFLKYINNCITLSNETYYGDNDKKLQSIDCYDVLISGSDQILNMTITGNSKSYYLCFTDKARKISYASSFGRTDLSKEELMMIKDELIKFDALSVREKSAGDIIYSITSKRPEFVLDPVFLLEREEWEKRCNKKLCLPDKYIFVYSMEETPLFINSVKKIALEFDLPMILVCGGGEMTVVGMKKDTCCGPEDFLRYIRDAELVVTNSFHGTAFSIIFKKRMFCISHSTRNTRIENILQLINQNDKLITTEDDSVENKIIYCDKCDSVIERYINLSKDYLNRNLK